MLRMVTCMQSQNAFPPVNSSVILNLWPMILIIELHLYTKTISIAEPLQNWQHAQSPYLGQIWHATVGQWSMLIDLLASGSVYCVAHVGQKTAEMSQFRPIFSHYGGSCAHRCLPIRGQIWQEIVDPWSTLTCQISSESVYCGTFQGRKTAIFGKFWHVEGCCTHPPLPMRAKFGMDL